MEPLTVTPEDVAAELATIAPDTLDRAVQRVANRKLAARISELEAELAAVTAAAAGAE